MRKVVFILVVLVGFVILSGFGPNGSVFAEEDGVVGLWVILDLESCQYVFTLHFLVDGSFVSYCYDRDFCGEKAERRNIREKGTYAVSGDSIRITISESDFPERVGISFELTFSRTDFLITFTNAPQLTFGYTDEDEITLEDDARGPSRIVGWWAIYDPNEIENSPLFGIRLDGFGSFYAYVPGRETGTYIVSGDSITITITESDLPDRVGIRFTVTFLVNEYSEPMIVFTNAPMLTAGWTQEETIALMRALTAVRPSTWGKIKSSYR